MIVFKRIAYGTVQVGEELESTDLVVKPEDVDTFAYAVDDHHPWYFEDVPLGGRIAPPTIFDNEPSARTVTAGSAQRRGCSLRPRTAHVTIDRRP